MNEYLDKDYVLRLVKQTSGDNRVPSNWIEVPQGANYAYKATRGAIVFMKTRNEIGSVRDSEILWQRSPSFEYINKTTGEYCKTSEAVDCEQWIEVPDGAECLTKCIDSNNDTWFLFWKGNYKICVGHDDDWYDFEADVKEYLSSWSSRVHILWQRPTQPEALPFVDDEPSLNAEIEKVRQTTIADTLAARQATYGSFEDVACVTQDLLAILKRTGLDSLPKPHKEALHMICSKMARIVNGDHNHSDSWHDIGGYAKLIEDLID